MTKRFAEGGQREAEWLAGLISGQPLPPRDVAFGSVLAAIGWRFFVTMGLFAALGLIFAAIALAGGPIVLRVSLAAFGVVGAAAFLYVVVRHVLNVRAAARSGINATSKLLELRVRSIGDTDDWHDIRAEGTLLVRHPRGDFHDKFEVTPRSWVPKVAPGDEIDVVVHPDHKKVLVYLGPPRAAHARRKDEGARA